jgi:hypothetical protein
VLVIVVDSAPLSGEPSGEPPGERPGGPTGPQDAPPPARSTQAGQMRTLYLDGRPELAEDIVSEIMRSGEEHCFVVGDLRQAVLVRRVVGFVRQALWRTRVTGWAAPTSPFRLAVALARLEALERDDPLPRGGHEIALKEIVRQTHGVMATASVRRLRGPRATLLQRATFPRRGGLYLVADRPSVRSVWVLRPQAQALHPYLRPDPVPGGHAATVAAGPEAPDVTRLLGLLGVEQVSAEHVDADPAWTARWGTAAPAEIVLEPAADGLLTETVRSAVARSWGCTWCDTKVSGLEPCAVCGAGVPTNEPSRPAPRRRRVAALQSR